MTLSRTAPWLFALLAVSLAGCDFKNLLNAPKLGDGSSKLPSTAPNDLAPTPSPAQMQAYLKQAAGFSANLKQAAGLGAILTGPTGALKQAAGLNDRVPGMGSYRIAAVEQASSSESITWGDEFGTGDGSLVATGSVIGMPGDKPTTFDLDLTIATASAEQLAPLKGARIQGRLTFDSSSTAPGLKTQETPLTIAIGTDSYQVDFQYLIVKGATGPQFKLVVPLVDPNSGAQVYVGWNIVGSSPDGWVATNREGTTDSRLGRCWNSNGQWLAAPVGTSSATASAEMPPLL